MPEVRHYSRAAARPRERSRLQLTPDRVGGTRIDADASRSAADDALLLYIYSGTALPLTSPPPLTTRDSITKCKIFVLNSHHIFDARDLMADWGWGFTNPQPLPNPILSRAKGNFQLAIQKKETEVSLRLTNFVLQYV